MVITLQCLAAFAMRNSLFKTVGKECSIGQIGQWVVVSIQLEFPPMFFLFFDNRIQTIADRSYGPE